MKKLIFIALLFTLFNLLYGKKITDYKTYDDGSAIFFTDEDLILLKTKNYASTLVGYGDVELMVYIYADVIKIIFDDVLMMPYILKYSKSDDYELKFKFNETLGLESQDDDAFYIMLINKKYDIKKFMQYIFDFDKSLFILCKYKGDIEGFSFDFTHMKKEIINTKLYKEIVK